MNKKHEYLRFFLPRYLSAKEWLTEEINTTLETYFNDTENTSDRQE